MWLGRYEVVREIILYMLPTANNVNITYVCINTPCALQTNIYWQYLGFLVHLDRNDNIRQRLKWPCTETLTAARLITLEGQQARLSFQQKVCLNKLALTLYKLFILQLIDLEPTRSNTCKPFITLLAYSIFVPVLK